jgi:hypothetical protein
MRFGLTNYIKLKACGPNEEHKRLCKAEKIVMPPVRAGAGRSLDADNEDGDRDERDDYEPD